MIRRAAALALGVWCAASGARAADVAVELKAYPAQTMVGRGFYVQAIASNVGATNVNGVSYSLVVESLGGLVTKATTSGSVISPLNSGMGSGVTYSFVGTKAGSVRFTFTLAGTEAGTGAPVRVSSEPLVVGIGDETVNRPASGTFQIRGNIIRVKKDDFYPVREMMYLVVQGPAGGVVSFAVHGPSGRRIDHVTHQLTGGTSGGIEEWTIGGDGRLTVPFDGVIQSQLLESGPYWMVVTGAVTGKQPFVVVKK